MEILIPIVLVVLGLSLIVVEVYLIPGINIFGILGLVLIVFAIAYSFTESGPAAGALALVGSSGITALMFWGMWRSGAWEKFVLSASLKRGAGDTPKESEQRSRCLGQCGMAITPLRPTGIVEIDGTRIEVVTEGEFIAAGSSVRVVAMDRRRFFVRMADKPGPDVAET